MDVSFSLGAELNPPQYVAWTTRLFWVHGSRSLCQIPRFRAWTGPGVHSAVLSGSASAPGRAVGGASLCCTVCGPCFTQETLGHSRRVGGTGAQVCQWQTRRSTAEGPVWEQRTLWALFCVRSPVLSPHNPHPWSALVPFRAWSWGVTQKLC